MSSRPRTFSYTIEIEGILHEHWEDWFGDVSISYREGKNTVITCFDVDFAKLYGILISLGDLNAHLIRVERIELCDTDTAE